MTDCVIPKPQWTCFHCGDTFTTPGAARDHFGFDPSCDPACRIKIGAERGLVIALRKAEREIEELRHLLHDDASEAYRMYANQAVRHCDQLQTMEELGYERGVADGEERAMSKIGNHVVRIQESEDYRFGWDSAERGEPRPDWPDPQPSAQSREAQRMGWDAYHWEVRAP